jgi:hypothetical protein
VSFSSLRARAPHGRRGPTHRIPAQTLAGLALGDRWFADSPVEGAVTSEPVSEPKFPVRWENTGYSRYYVAGATTLSLARDWTFLENTEVINVD